MVAACGAPRALLFLLPCAFHQHAVMLPQMLTVSLSLAHVYIWLGLVVIF